MRISLPIMPEMRCDSGCGVCCTIVFASEREYQVIRRHAKAFGIKPKRQGGACPWYQDGVCKVYEVRPKVCRLFGHVEKLTCPLGYNVNVAREVERKFMADYKPERCLHEILGGGWEDEFGKLLDDELARIKAATGGA